MFAHRLRYRARMCGRFVLATDYDQIEKEFNATHSGMIPSMSWNVKPMDQVPVIGQDTGGHNHLQVAQWSLVTPDAVSAKPEYPTFNARIETALEKPTFALAAHWHRVLVPISGFYEWDTDRRPWYFHDPGQPTLYLAGLYNWWQDRKAPDRRWILTFTILTCDSTPEAGRIHKRMPVLVGEDHLVPWLDRRLDGARILPVVRKLTWNLAERLEEYQVAPIRGDSAENICPLRA